MAASSKKACQAGPHISTRCGITPFFAQHRQCETKTTRPLRSSASERCNADTFGLPIGEAPMPTTTDRVEPPFVGAMVAVGADRPVDVRRLVSPKARRP
jgi:hypothetical protein